MEAAKNGYDRIATSVGNIKFLLENTKGGETLTHQESGLLKEADEYRKKFDGAMDDDFNTADALSAVFELVKFINTHVSEKSSRAFLSALKEEILLLCDICGLILDRKEEMLDAEVERLIEERREARKARNFARADEIRNQLLEKGIILEDTREGVKWKRA